VGPDILSAARRVLSSATVRLRRSSGRRSDQSGPTPSNADGYDAFVSYSRDVDGKLAPAMQTGLQRFAKPWYRKRALRIFRDDASLSANPDLWGSIVQALDASEFFVLLASPRAAQSKWVGKEVRYWLERKPHDRLLIALSEGAIVWDRTDGMSGSDIESALPAVLRGALPGEPRYTDLSWARREEHLSLADPRFRAAIADLASPLHGIPKDELIGEEVRQHRRTVRVAVSAAMGLASLATLAVLAALLAVNQRNTARRERDVAKSRLLAAEAANESVPTALLLSIEALRTKDTVEARGALLASLERPSAQAVAYLHGHHDIVWNMARSPDGKTVASGSRDGTIILWDVERHRPQGAPLRGDGATVTGVAFSPNGRTLASGSAYHAVYLWDLHSRRRIAFLPERDSVTTVAISPDGRTLAAGTLAGSAVHFWDVAQRRSLNVPSGDNTTAGFVNSVAFSPDGRTLASATSDWTVELWDVRTRRRTSVLAYSIPDEVKSVAFSPDGKTLAAGGEGGTVLLWDVRSRRREGGPLSGRGSVQCLAFSPDGKTLASGSTDRTIVLWDVRHRRRLGAPLRGHADAVRSLVFGTDGKSLISGGADGTIIVWDLERTLRLGVRIGDRRSLALAFNPEGTILASDDRRSVVLWDVVHRSRLGEPLRAHTDSVEALAFSPDGKTIATGSWDKKVILWNVKQHRPRGPPLAGHTSVVHAVAFSPDGRTLASGGSDNRIILWDVATHRRRATLRDRDQIAAVAFSPDGKTLAAGLANGTITLWAVASGRRLAQLGGGHGWVENLAFSPDGTSLASASSQIVLSDIGKQPRGELLSSNASGVSFSPDGKLLSFGRDDGSVVLWDIQGRHRLGAFAGHRKRVITVAFSPDGKTLASASADDTRILWDVRVASWKQRACALANRNMSLAEWDRFIGTRPYLRTCPNLPAGEGAPANAPAAE
jgi:WD40 repeat protein